MTTINDVAITVARLTVAYGTNVVLHDVNAAFATATITGIIGPNGAGKSTLLKAMLRLVPPITGRVDFFGRPLDEVRQQVGYIPQTSAVDWDYPATVYDVVRMGTYRKLGLLRRTRADDRSAIAQAMEDTGIADLAGRPIGQLSGGQRQRTFLARTLAARPDVLIMDEPFQGIDAASQHAIIELLRSLRDRGKTIIIVHHDLLTVGAICDEVLILGAEKVVSGTVHAVLTAENIRRAYGLEHDVTFLPGVPS